ncbi:MAG: T9SS type A sorting domain-containing protein [Saprospiraceae bacterium]|nr:T9SS type A sorting domain-containing protein [Saprospiraceae bacterium]
MNKFLIFVFILLGLNYLNSQKYDFNWIMGERTALIKDSLDGTAILNFNSQNGSPLIQSTKKINTDFWYYGTLISDMEGEFMFHFHGNFLFDYFNYKGVNGYKKICPQEFCAYDPQSCLILPGGMNDTSYSLLTTESKVVGDTFAYVLNLRNNFHQLVNSTNNTGVTIVSTNNLFLSDSIDIGKITACRHANGRDWWIIIGRYNKPEVYTILFDGNKVVRSFIQNIGRIPENQSNGYSCFSPKGNYYCSTSIKESNNLSHGIFELYDFDRCSGQLKNRQFDQLDTTPTIAFGCAFSPDSRFLYLSSSYYLYQYEIIDGKLSNKTVIAEYDGHIGHVFDNNTSSSTFGNLQLAPDGRIYSNPEFLQSRYMHIINKPNKSGAACDFIQHSVRLKSIITTTPSFPNYRLGPIDGSICDSLDIDNIPWCWWRYNQDTSSHLCFEFTDLSAYEVAEWYWDFGDGTQSRDTSPIHCFSKNGNYKVCLIVKNQYGSDTLCRTLNIGTTGIINNERQEIQTEIFPNPARDYLIINIPDYIPENMKIKLFNSQGSEVLDQRIYQGSNIIDTDQLINGIYFVYLRDMNGLLKTYKILIE